jgi:hypothetical protein
VPVVILTRAPWAAIRDCAPKIRDLALARGLLEAVTDAPSVPS